MKLIAGVTLRPRYILFNPAKSLCCFFVERLRSVGLRGGMLNKWARVKHARLLFDNEGIMGMV